MRLRSHLLLFCRSVVSDSLRPHGLQLPQASLSFIVSWSLLKFMSIELVMPPKHLILCHPLLFLPQSFPASGSFLMSWLFTLPGQSIGASASGSVLPMNIHSELISFRIDWFDLLAVQRTLKSLLQHHSSKASILQCSAFFTVQLSHPYMTTGKLSELFFQGAGVF